ncbi:pilus assembly protein TadG-related protein [Streptomyces sp. NRAIS4]
MPPRRDAGQAFPIYITVVAGLLFLALAYLAVGQASVNRSGAQTAADAAALAAAQKTRDQLAATWVENVLDPTKWNEIFDGGGALDSCWRADQLAAQNDASDHCAHPEPLRYTVEVQTNKPVGESIVPGIENKKSKASATAVVERLCTFPPSDGKAAGKKALPQLTCKGRNWDLNPDDLTDLPKPQDLFDVHLANDQ